MRLPSLQYLQLFVSISLPLLLVPDSSLGVKVLSFQEDGIATGQSVGIYKGEMSRNNHIYSFTFCMRFKIFYLHQRGTIFFIYDTVEDKCWMLRGGNLRKYDIDNPNIDNPNIDNPNIDNPNFDNPNIDNPNIDNPNIDNPNIDNPNIDNPNIDNPNIDNPNIDNPNIDNPNIDNPNIDNPNIDNPNIDNPNIDNPNIDNPNIDNPNIDNPNIDNPNIDNPNIDNPNIDNLNIDNPNIGVDRGLIQTFLDGEKVQQSYYTVDRPVFGDFAAVGNGQAPEDSFSGDITQVNVWDRVLSDEDIRGMAQCKSDPKGNFISWEVGWKLNNATSYDQPLAKFCQVEEEKLYFWFPEVSDYVGQYVCEALGTHLPHVTSLEEAEDLYHQSEVRWPESDHCPLYYWSSLNDRANENVWVAAYDTKIIDNSSYWGPDEPNGYRYENCAAVKRVGLIDDDCAWDRCALCIFTEPQRFSFLGTCEPELRNVYFVAYQEEYGGLVFKSYGAYHIKKENGTWLYVDTVNDYTIAIMEHFVPHFPMGRRVWRLEREVCGQESGGRREMLLTPCHHHQYTCDDGTCIPHHYRCDLKYDCRDRSDEMECELISFPSDYHQHLPPRVPGKEDSKLPVIVKFIIKSIDVETVKMSMQLSYEIEMSWFDNRLNYFNLKTNDSLNSPRLDTMRKLWSPLVKLLNTDTIDSSLLADDATTLVRRLVPPLGRDEGAAAEVDIYSGEENPLSVSRKYSTIYACSFDLTLYPFDNQYCDVHLQIVSGQVSFLDVHPNSSVVYLGGTVLNEYKIGTLQVFLEKDYEPGEARIRVPMTRLFGNSILTIYIPSLILTIISYLTFFFRTSIFDVRVMVALTSLLVLATLFAQASSSLPKTSYFKMVDIWLLFCVGITFLVIIFHVLIDNRFVTEMSNTKGQQHQQQQTKVKAFHDSTDFREVLLATIPVIPATVLVPTEAFPAIVPAIPAVLPAIVPGIT
ncbi:hypothetical protein Pmani_018391 [Petrolisthes manimaculis]|uniref:C-type lectin domain-containing protein n=1 Tax=Petrolisthes manimaculis TaxID=1843537 RepID=A0AAE1PL34_9EUCA|nr:hypothetical protein Pmani_018391 [Petrolisthes manimaculis]